MAPILIVEQCRSDPTIWRYDLAGADGKMVDPIRQLRYDEERASEPLDGNIHGLWRTAVLLVRRAKGSTQIAYSLRIGDDRQPPPEPLPRPRWERSRTGKVK